MSERPWFERYFGADYLRIYRLADTAEQRAMLAEVLPPPAAAPRLLDVPCGHGRHAVWLTGLGYRVTGVDLSRTFLHVAQAAARHGFASLALARADMRRFPLGDRVFDAAICMFTSLGYFDALADNQRVLEEFGRVLRPGGRFVLDLANIDAVRRQIPHAQWEKDGVRVESEYLFDEATKRATTRRLAHFADGRSELYESSVRLFEGPEIERMLTSAGFAIDDQRGAYAGGPVSPELPRRILIASRR